MMSHLQMGESHRTAGSQYHKYVLDFLVRASCSEKLKKMLSHFKSGTIMKSYILMMMGVDILDDIDYCLPMCTEQM